MLAVSQLFKNGFHRLLINGLVTFNLLYDVFNHHNGLLNVTSGGHLGGRVHNFCSPLPEDMGHNRRINLFLPLLLTKAHPQDLLLHNFFSIFILHSDLHTQYIYRALLVPQWLFVNEHVDEIDVLEAGTQVVECEAQRGGRDDGWVWAMEERYRKRADVTDGYACVETHCTQKAAQSDRETLGYPRWLFDKEEISILLLKNVQKNFLLMITSKSKRMNSEVIIFHIHLFQKLLNFHISIFLHSVGQQEYAGHRIALPPALEYPKGFPHTTNNARAPSSMQLLDPFPKDVPIEFSISHQACQPLPHFIKLHQSQPILLLQILKQGLQCQMHKTQLIQFRRATIAHTSADVNNADQVNWRTVDLQVGLVFRFEGQQDGHPTGSQQAVGRQQRDQLDRQRRGEVVG